jgi:hypothetical protein
MAHYVAELLSRTETSSGTEKSRAERECFDVILQLWRHRASLPGDHPPMRSLEPVLSALQNLVNYEHPRYFRHVDSRLDAQTQKALEVAVGIDYAARDLIRWWIAIASADVLKREERWFKSATARALDDGEDLQAGRLLAETLKTYIGEPEQGSERQTEELRIMRDRLDSMVKASKVLRKQIDAALKGTSAPNG